MTAKARKYVTLGILLALAAGGGTLGWRSWRHAQVYVSTENAYVQGDIYAVASRIPGTLSALSVTGGQAVRKGDVIATLDPQDYDVALRRAEAALAEAEAGMLRDQAMIAQYEAQAAAARSQLDLARVEKGRIEALYGRQSMPRQRMDQVATQEEVASAALTALHKTVEAARAELAVGRSKVASAQASLEAARLQRSYCTIVSPIDGYVSHKSAEVGHVVAPGQPLCAVVPLTLDRLWIEANFKETQLTRVRPGQRAKIWADIDPARVFSGVVESLSAGTGAAFSLLPAENATGNWVKIVQRVPVRIRIDPGSDPDHKLRLGLSVQVEIDTTGQ